MSKSITLKHGRFSMPKKVEYFYDGLLVAEDGLLTIPANRPDWAKRAWFKGYNLTPQGDRIWTADHLTQEIQRQTA